ncbi:sulfite exporter TauE/SafE family protein [uncultured Thiohalocapsa sp.]|uniref:sulfite exporter TauE/SafE family protein n=1 Tax=uncultured Thiohalocapsa sp. TaxID=768990 RepID=UPI0025D423DC|nr:sulfite exporter TauE/SafE family protein [uncultured Thiohalocapsa sp.]
MPDAGLIPVALVLLASAFVHGVFGFGFPMLATPLLALGMDLRAAVQLTLLPTIATNLGSIAGERGRGEALRRFWPIPVFTAVGSFAGTQVLLAVDPEPFRLLLGLVLVAYLLTERLHGGSRERRVPGWGLALLGLGMGLMAGVVNIFAPIVIVFALYTRMPAQLMVAAFNLSFVTSKSGQLLGFAWRDALDPGLMLQSLWALPGVLLALWLGIRLRRRIRPEHYRRLLRLGLWGLAAALVLDVLLPDLLTRA